MSWNNAEDLVNTSKKLTDEAFDILKKMNLLQYNFEENHNGVKNVWKTMTEFAFEKNENLLEILPELKSLSKEAVEKIHEALRYQELASKVNVNTEYYRLKPVFVSMLEGWEKRVRIWDILSRGINPFTLRSLKCSYSEMFGIKSNKDALKDALEKEKKMEEVIQILMRRDGLTRTEAIAEIDDFREEAYALMEEGAYDEVEDLLIDYLGLEPDYLTSLLL
jgi:hypothetical protein